MDAGIVLAVAAAVLAAVIALAIAYGRWVESESRRRVERIIRRLEREGRWRRAA